MNTIKRLYCRFPLLGSYLMSALFCNATVLVLLYIMTKPMGIVFTSNDPDLIILRYAMLVTTNLAMAPAFILVGYSLAGQFALDLVPIRDGIYEWYNEKGEKKFISVCDVGINEQYLRAYWCGGYYDIRGRVEQLYNANGKPIKTYWKPSEWTGGVWGKRINDLP